MTKITVDRVNKLAEMANFWFDGVSMKFRQIDDNAQVGPKFQNSREAYFWIQGFLSAELMVRHRIDEYNSTASQRLAYSDFLHYFSNRVAEDRSAL